MLCKVHVPAEHCFKMSVLKVNVHISNFVCYNIPIFQTEAPLMIRPFLPDLTLSELHAVMTGGFATIAGGVMGAYMQMGVSPTHILSASVMSAPAALAVSKLLYPETEEPKSKTVDQIHIDKG